MSIFTRIASQIHKLHSGSTIFDFGVLYMCAWHNRVCNFRQCQDHNYSVIDMLDRRPGMSLSGYGEGSRNMVLPGEEN